MKMSQTLVSCLLLSPIASLSAFDPRVRLPSHSSRCVVPLSSTIPIHKKLCSRLDAARRSLSAADRERRDEEKRRQERLGDVVIGKTSARKGESDYALDVKATEAEYLRQASRVEQEIYRSTEQGMHHLKMLEVEEASRYFDRVFELRPTAYLWQAGIAKYYLNELEEAANIFAQAVSVFESRFGEPASEERIWRNACELKLLSSINKQERKRVEEKQGGIASQLTPVRNTEKTAELLASERRKVVRIARELFDASIQRDNSALIFSRAKLRSIGGPYTVDTTTFVLDKKMWKLNAWFYLGLHYDAVGNVEESKKCMKMALRLCPSGGNAPDIVHTLPMLHMARRDWFDDDQDFESNLFENSDNTREQGGSDQDAAQAKECSNAVPSNQFLPAPKVKRISNPFASDDIDPVMTETMKHGIDELTVEELREALQFRGISAVGSKDKLREKLFNSLLRDAGFEM